MSCSSGPNIVTSGLICNIDFSNKKSFSGIGSDRVGGINPTFSAWGGLTGSSVSYTSKYGPGVFLQTIAGGGVNYWYSNYGNQACSSSTQYIVTARIKYVGSSTSPSANLFYVRQYNSSGAQTSESGKFSTSQMIALGDDWYMAYAYFTTDSTAVNFYIHGYEYSGNMRIFIEDLQCKLAGATDITNNGYNFSLSGTPTLLSNCAQFNTSTYMQNYLNMTSGTYTIVAASRYTGGADGRVIASINNNCLLGHHGGLHNRYYSEGWMDYGDTNTNEWKIYTGASNTNSDVYDFYSNNIYRASNQNGSQGFNGIQINGYNHSYEKSNCQVGILLVYNKILTFTEVKQNFNALRGRYGI